MPRRPLLPLLIALAFIAAALTAAVAQTTPRAAPNNDDFANAQTIALNGKYKIDDVHLATTDLNDVKCTPWNLYSVWFKFTAPFSGAIALSVNGSRYVSPSGSVSALVYVSAYTGNDVDSLSTLTCGTTDSVPPGYIPSLNITSGTTYHIRVATHSAPEAGSYYKLKTQVLWTSFAPNQLDQGFENGLPIWTVKDATNGDGIICGSGEVIAGNCSFKFVGGRGEATKLQQTILWPTAIVTGVVGQSLYSGAQVTSTGPSTDLKMIVKLNYSDGTPTTKATVTRVTAPAGIGSLTLSVEMESAALVSIKQIFKNRSTGGTTVIDNAGVSYVGGLVLRDMPAGVLPVPAPAQ